MKVKRIIIKMEDELLDRVDNVEVGADLNSWDRNEVLKSIQTGKTYKESTVSMIAVAVCAFSLLLGFTVGRMFERVDSAIEAGVATNNKIAQVEADIDNTSVYKESYEKKSETQETQEVYGASQFKLYEAGALHEILEKNAYKAKRNFENKYVAVIGKLSNIDASGSYIYIDPVGSRFTIMGGVQCYTQNNQYILNKVEQLSDGQTLIVYGQMCQIGEILGYGMNIIDIEALTDEQVASLRFSDDGSITTADGDSDSEAKGEDDGMTMSQRNAVRDAQDYLETVAFSKERN